MRDDDPDEADETGDGDGRRRPERRRHDQSESYPPHIDPETRRLVVHVARVRLAVVAAATIGTAAAVALSGLIGFVGIIVPHTIRLLAGVGYRVLLPLSAIVGAGFLVLADVVARTALAPAEIPLGVVTAFFGAPFFWVVLRTMRSGA